MWSQYWPLLFLLSITILLGFGVVLLTSYLSKKCSSSLKKRAPYECGFEPVTTEPLQVDIRFYLVALLFIIFDLEIAFLFPWALLMRSCITLEAFWGMMLFILVLTVGFLYEWRKGALQWE